MSHFEYIRWFWKYTDDETPILLFYEVDTANERYATRMVEVFLNRKIQVVEEAGYEFITEAPVPNIAEINMESEFYAEIISKNEFESVYAAKEYLGEITFPQK